VTRININKIRKDGCVYGTQQSAKDPNMCVRRVFVKRRGSRCSPGFRKSRSVGRRRQCVTTVAYPRVGARVAVAGGPVAAAVEAAAATQPLVAAAKAASRGVLRPQDAMLDPATQNELKAIANLSASRGTPSRGQIAAALAPRASSRSTPLESAAINAQNAAVAAAVANQVAPGSAEAVAASAAANAAMASAVAAARSPQRSPAAQEAAKSARNAAEASGDAASAAVLSASAATPRGSPKPFITQAKKSRTSPQVIDLVTPGTPIDVRTPEMDLLIF